jgi:hypothetical protein
LSINDLFLSTIFFVSNLVSSIFNAFISHQGNKPKTGFAPSQTIMVYGETGHECPTQENSSGFLAKLG